MINSNDKKVQNFLEEIRMIDFEKFEMLQELRKIVFDNSSDVKERISYGGIMFSHNSEDFGGIFVRKKHISFEFSLGINMKDPDNLLEGKGKFRRHLKIRSKADIEIKTTDNFVKQALKII